MKNDMSGSAAVRAAMTVLREVGCRARVTAHLSCTDNMPSGSLMQLATCLRRGPSASMFMTSTVLPLRGFGRAGRRGLGPRIWP